MGLSRPVSFAPGRPTPSPTIGGGGASGLSASTVDWSSATLVDPNSADDSSSVASGSVVFVTNATNSHASNSSQGLEYHTSTGFAFAEVDDALVLSADISNLSAWASGDAFGIGVRAASGTYYCGWARKTASGWQATAAEKGASVNTSAGRDNATTPASIRVTVTYHYDDSTHALQIKCTLLDSGGAVLSTSKTKAWSLLGPPTGFAAVAHDTTAVAKTVDLTNFEQALITASAL